MEVLKAVLPNRAEPLSTAIKLRELAVLGETLAILRASFQACVVVIGEIVSSYCRRRLVRCRLVRMSVSTNRVFVFVPVKAALCMTNFSSVSTVLVSTNIG